MDINNFKVEGDTLTYGYYPQKKSNLSKDYFKDLVYKTEFAPYGLKDDKLFYEFEGEYYEVLPIKFRIFKFMGMPMFALSELVLDVHRFDKNQTDYDVSEIKDYLNNKFLKMAFLDGGKRLGEFPGVDYKISLPSLYDLMNTSNGFYSEDDRTAKATDFAIKKDVYHDEDTLNAYYWTRTSDDNMEDEPIQFVFSIDYDGYDTSDEVNVFQNGIRIYISPRF